MYFQEAEILENNEATEENVLSVENQKANGILHIATHGFAFVEAKGKLDSISKKSIKYNLSYNSNPMKRCGLILAGMLMSQLMPRLSWPRRVKVV